MVKIIATDYRGDCKVTSEGGSEKDSFFKSAIAVYDAMHTLSSSEEITTSFLVEILNYMVDREAEWIAGDAEECRKQDRCLNAVVLALGALKRSVRTDSAIEKAKAFIEEVKRDKQ